MSQTLQLLIRGLEGKTIIVPHQANITKDSKVIDIKNFLQKKQGIDPQEQRLIFAAKELRDTHNLSEYAIQNNSNITLALRLRGGADKKIKLKIVLANDNQFEINIRLKATIYQLKVQIEKKDDFLTADNMGLKLERDKYLSNEKRIEEYKFDDNDVLTQCKEDISNKINVELSDEPDVVTFEDDDDLPRAKMPCNHAISTESMTQLLRSLVTNGKYQIKCPGFNCGVQWDYSLCRQIGVLTKDELQQFELGIEENYATKQLGIKECLYCHCFLFKPSNISENKFECTGCQIKNKKKRYICWKCMKEWKVSSDKTPNFCGNMDCGVEDFNKILATCNDKSMMSKGKVPECRACPKCKTLIHHTDGCQIMKCTNCESSFCFCCLKIGKCDYSTPCLVAPRQKF